MGEILGKSIHIEGNKINLEGPLTEDELITLYQLLGKFGGRCWSISDTILLLNIRHWVESYLQGMMKEGKKNEGKKNNAFTGG